MRPAKKVGVRPHNFTLGYGNVRPLKVCFCLFFSNHMTAKWEGWGQSVQFPVRENNGYKPLSLVIESYDYYILIKTKT